ncbi:MAG: ribosome-associated translation inhibitor RaiA [Rhodomicrobium sp.]|nr:ribosome-associated translation inhibitor RaiA [Rhodomicrobium sp.]
MARLARDLHSGKILMRAYSLGDGCNTTQPHSKSMTLQVTGKNIDLGTALRGYIADKLDKAFDKYGSQSVSTNVFIEKEHGQFITTCTVHLKSGLSLQASGTAGEAHPSVDEAMDRLEKRLRRYKRRLKNHHNASQSPSETELMNAVDYVIRQHNDEEESAETELAPTIVAETQVAIHELSVGDAVMAMDLAEKPFLIFKNASHGRVNIVYRRDDGHIGWVDPGGLSRPLKPKR